MPKGKKILFLIFFLAFLVRLISLDQSLWLDEATTARVVHKYNFFEIVTKFSPNDFHPPLYYLIMKVWTNMFGYSEIALRMPSILFSLLTGYLVYLLGNKITNNDSGPHSAEASRGKQAGMTSIYAINNTILSNLFFILLWAVGKDFVFRPAGEYISLRNFSIIDSCGFIYKVRI